MNAPKSSHGLKGKKGNNQTKKGRNLRYVIQARDFLKRHETKSR